MQRAGGDHDLTPVAASRAASRDRTPSAVHSTDARADRRAHSLAQYRRRADVYDLELSAFEPIRERALQRLAVMPGQTVLDIGCGTGLSFAALRDRVREHGRVVGVEHSPDMLDIARGRVGAGDWRNVRLEGRPVHLARLPAKADAAFFHFTHDILREADAIDHVLAHLRPGASVVATGLKWAGGWSWPVNWLVLGAALHSVTSLEGLQQPWDRLAASLDDVVVETLWLDAIFIVRGTVRG